MNDGGPAFPRPASEYTGSGTCPDGNDAIREEDGMSLRDWFAGQALSGLLSATGGWRPSNPSKLEEAFFGLTNLSYMLADEMVKVRNNPPASEET